MDAVDLAVDGVNFSLIQADAGDNEALTLLCDFGPLPLINRGRVLEKLLETNLGIFGHDAPVFAMSPDFKRVLLMRRVLFIKMSALDVMNMMVRHAAHAMEWRKTYYLDDSGYQLKLRRTEKDRYKLSQLSKF
jgi:hypothetical protein